MAWAIIIFHAFSAFRKSFCAIQTRVHETCSLHRKPQSIIEKFPLRISSVSLLQSDIFRPRIRTRLYFKMCPLVLRTVIELSLVTLWQVRICSIVIYLSLPSHSWFLSYRVSLVFLCATSYIKQHPLHKTSQVHIQNSVQQWTNRYCSECSINEMSKIQTGSDIKCPIKITQRIQIYHIVRSSDMEWTCCSTWDNYMLKTEHTHKAQLQKRKIQAIHIS